ncbi:MAG: hypothetical protein R2715_19680 [Ilumatobacteraceae bacterium]
MLRTDLMQTLRSDHITFARGDGVVAAPGAARAIAAAEFPHADLGDRAEHRLLTRWGSDRRATVLAARFCAFTTEAILTQDVVKVQGAVLLVGVFYVVINLLVDIMLTVLDPGSGWPGVRQRSG